MVMPDYTNPKHVQPNSTTFKENIQLLQSTITWPQLVCSWICYLLRRPYKCAVVNRSKMASIIRLNPFAASAVDDDDDDDESD